MSDSAAGQLSARSSSTGFEHREDLDFEQIAKAGALLVAVVYSVGLLTANAYLEQFEITNFSFWKPQAILTGALVVLSLVLFAIPVLSAVGSAARTGSTRKFLLALLRPPSALKLLLPLPLALLISLPLSRANPVYSGLTEWGDPNDLADHWILRGFGAAVSLWISAAGTAVLGIEAIRFYRRALKLTSFSGMATGWAKMAILSTGCIFSMAAYIYQFSEAIYSHIPQRWGGGQCEQVLFQADPAAKGYLQELGISFIDGTNITNPLKLLYESEDSVVVLRSWVAIEKTKTSNGVESTDTTLVPTATPPKPIRLDKKLFHGSVGDFDHAYKIFGKLGPTPNESK